MEDKPASVRGGKEEGQGPRQNLAYAFCGPHEWGEGDGELEVEWEMPSGPFACRRGKKEA